jgi:hypothetical protein
MVMDLHAYARIMTSREPELWRHVGHHLTASGIRRASRRPEAPVADGRARVLVENPDAAVRAVMAQVLGAAGYAVETCAGPRAHDCPVLAGKACPMAARSDVVVSGLGLTRPASRAVVQGLRTLHPRPSILVDAPGPQVAAHPEVVEGCEVLTFPCTRASLLSAVQAQVKAS